MKKNSKKINQSEGWNFKFNFQARNGSLTESRAGVGLKIGQLVLEKFEYESCEFCKNEPFSYFFAIFSACKHCAQKPLLTSDSDKLKKHKNALFAIISDWGNVQKN